MGPKQKKPIVASSPKPAAANNESCPHCGHRFSSGGADSKERLTHIAACKAVPRAPSLAASPTTAIAPQHRRDSGAVGTVSPVAFPQSVVSWTVSSGGLTNRMDAVGEEIAMVTAMHSDTTTVLHEDNTDRFPALQIDVAATPELADADAPGDGSSECRVLLTFEYTLGYPGVAPNVSLCEAVKGSLRPAAARYVLTKLGEAIRSNVAQQQPMVLALVGELHDALGSLTRVRGDGDRVAFDHVVEPSSPVPVSPANGPTQPNANASVTTVAFGRTKATPMGASMGASQPGSNLSTPLHGAHRAAMVVPPAPLGQTLIDVSSHGANSNLLASSSNATRALETFTLHLLHRLCSNSTTLPPNAEQTIKVYLEDIGLLTDARRELNERVLRRFFRGPMESARDPVLSWLWSTGDGSAVTSPTGQGPTTAVMTMRFDREFAILGVLGTGGFGSVLACLRHIDQRRYAVKRVVVKASKSDFVLREVRTLAALDHPNIVKYYDAWLEAGKHGDFVPTDSDDEEEEDSGYDSDYFNSQHPTGGGGKRKKVRSNSSNASEEPVQRGRRRLTLDERRERWEAERDRRRQERHAHNVELFGEVSDEDDDDGNLTPFDSDEDEWTSVEDEEEAASRDDMGMPRTTTGSTTDAEPAYTTLFVQMELCHPKTLADYINDGTLRRREGMMFHILRQLLGVLSFVHAQGSMHRDLKPANVLFDASASANGSFDVQCDIKVADFGLARKLSEADVKPLGADPTSSNHAEVELLTGGCGTPLYAAPEQTSGETTYDAVVDEYSVGIIFYEMWLSAARDYNLWERREAINELRRTATVPAWLRESQPIVADVVEALVRHDPMTRATADQILNMSGLPGEAPEVTAALSTISAHRDQLVHKVMKRLLTTARDPHLSSSAAVPPQEVVRLISTFERAAILRHATSIDAQLEIVAYAHLPELGASAAEVLTPSPETPPSVVTHSSSAAVQYDWALTHRGDPVVLLRDPVLCVGSWFARHSRNLSHAGPCHRAYCIHTHEAEAVFGTYSVCGFNMSTGFLLCETMAFAGAFLRTVAPMKGGYCLRLTHPTVAAEVKRLRRYIDLDLDRVDYAGPLPPAPSVKDLVRGPVRVHTVDEWKAVQNACNLVLDGAPPAVRAAFDELGDVVVELLHLRRPYDLPIEVHPFGTPSSLARPGSNIAATILRFGDDGRAHATTPLPPLSSTASTNAAATAAHSTKSASHHHHHSNRRSGHFPDHETVGCIVMDPFISGLPNHARQTAVGSYHVAVCALNLSLVERNCKAPLPAVGCTVALARSSHSSYNAWCGGNVALLNREEAVRVLVAAKDLWHHGVRAEALYRQERNEEVAAANAYKRGLTHCVALLADNQYRILRHTATAKEVKSFPLHTAHIGETTAKELAATKGAFRTNDTGSVAAPDSVPAGPLGAGASVPLETVESTVQIDFSSSVTAAFNSELRRRALAALAHYQRYLPPKRLLIVQDAEGDAVRQTLLNFANQAPVSGASTLDRGLFEWLRHHATHIGSLAVYTATSDTIDVLMNHRQLSQYYGSSDRREGRNAAKGPLKKR